MIFCIILCIPRGTESYAKIIIHISYFLNLFISEKEPREKYCNVALTYIDLNIMTFAFFSHFQVIKEELAPLINNNKREYKQMVYYAQILHTHHEKVGEKSMETEGKGDSYWFRSDDSIRIINRRKPTLSWNLQRCQVIPRSLNLIPSYSMILLALCHYFKLLDHFFSLSIDEA